MGKMKRLNVEHRLWLTAGALILLCLLGLPGDAFSQDTAIGEKIAQAYGVSGFGKIEEIKFTFNVKKGEIAASRSWIWRPKEDKVTFLGDGKTDKPVTYIRKEITADSPDTLRQIDAHFINDQYWLLFPFHLVWDSGMTVRIAGENVKYPMGGGSGRMVRVSYPPAGGGYTPGDKYELFLDDNDMISQWIYRRGGAEKPTVIATWQDNRHMGPIIISLNHLGADNNFRVWFTDVEMKLTGSDDMIKAE
jgi:hypothetical protein